MHANNDKQQSSAAREHIESEAEWANVAEAYVAFRLTVMLLHYYYTCGITAEIIITASCDCAFFDR